MDVTESRCLLLHMEWADSLAWNAALGVPALAQDESLLKRLYHFHSTQWAYLHLFQGSPIEVPQPQELPDLQSMGRCVRRFYRELAAFLDGLDEARLRQRVEFPFVARIIERFGSMVPTSVSECILQLALHTAHHRGQVMTVLRESGCEPPTIDFIVWLWTERPAPQCRTLDAA
jgi:uncharacterized damage-inducible protein DinB